jgi:ribose transport system ATP-binding protein
VWPSRQRAAARRWIDELGIRCSDVGQPAAELSGGNQQKVALARLLHHDVDLLILDEPTRGIDVASKAQIYALLDALVAADGTTTSVVGGGHVGPPLRPTTTVVGADQCVGPRAGHAAAPLRAETARPKAVLVVSSYLPELIGVCDRIAVMCRGKLGPARPVSEVSEQSLMMEATGATAAA